MGRHLSASKEHAPSSFGNQRLIWANYKIKKRSQIKFLSARWNRGVDEIRILGVSYELCSRVKLQSKADSSLLSNHAQVRGSPDRAKLFSRPLTFT